ncbi:MAG: ATP-binding cassette domain-containing protein [Candidatus Hydrogenedens sp.]|nr:ATP-binding cassette domain-containing protein [Candidatus Hydrogenedens sp.]
MSLVRFDNVNKSFGGDPLLMDVNLRVEEGERIALIGRNGTGKSTLFRLITGESDCDGGAIERMRRARIVYLSQIPETAPDNTVLDVALGGFEDLIHEEAALREMERRLHSEEAALLEEYGERQQAFSLAGGYEFRTRARQILCGLGFLPEDFDKPFSALSGGWRARLMLSLALLREADLLLLDEPENHLDMQAREWLEDHLANRPEAMILISHDRRMVNALAHRIMEIEGGALTTFTGNYDSWLKEKNLRREQQQKAFERQEAHIQKEQAWIDRFRAKNTKARQAQHKLKRLEKLERVEAPPADLATALFQLEKAERSGDMVLDARALTMAYGNNHLYTDLSFSLYRGDRLGIIGPNGSGKTTLLRHLGGKHAGLSGEVWTGHNVSAAFYDQHQESLAPDLDVLTLMQQAKPEWSQQQCRSYLGRFLFSADEVFKPAAILSGGERSRLALAKLIASGSNLLLLDEPTNHLDIASREALENGLAEYTGTLVVVSHDRTLIDRLTSRLLIVKEGRVRSFYGNFSQWREKERELESATQKKVDPEEDERRRKNLLEREQKKALEREQRREQRALQKIEDDIAQLENQIEEFHGHFAALDPADYEAAQKLQSEYNAMKKKLEELYEEWEALAAQ